MHCNHYDLPEHQADLYEVAYPETAGLWQQHNIRTQDGRYVLRGSSFLVSQSDVRCAARFDLKSFLRYCPIGFRVVQSPLL